MHEMSPALHALATVGDPLIRMQSTEPESYERFWLYERDCQVLPRNKTKRYKIIKCLNDQRQLGTEI